MPNYVHHNFTITGPKEERDRFMAECFTMDDKEGLQLDFTKLVPEPNWEENTNSAFVKEDTRRGDLTVKSGADFSFPDWYEWRCVHWGTKWNACSTGVDVQADEIGLSFDTAWSVPGPIIEQLAERFPRLRFEGTYIEEMQSFGGDIIIHDGEIDHNDRSEEIRAECEKWHEEHNRKHNIHAYGELLKFRAGEPHEAFSPGTIGETYAHLAMQMMDKNPALASLATPDEQNEFMEKVEEAYREGHAVKVTLTPQEAAYCKMLSPEKTTGPTN
jgi:hypothetical protein